MNAIDYPGRADRCEMLLDLRLTPYRSGHPRHMTILILAVGGLWFLVGLGFFAIGAWPVIGFLGLEGVLLWAALRWNRRSSQQFDHIRVTPEKVSIHSQGLRGDSLFRELSPFFLAVLPVKQGILLRQRGETVIVGGFLREAERQAAANQIAEAVSRTRDPALTPVTLPAPS